MKINFREWILLGLQLFLFYIFPFFAGPTDAMGMVVLIILGTFVLGAVLGMISRQKGKWLWPVCTAACFVPSIYIHYNETAWIHTLWYLVISAAGLVLGSVIGKALKR